MRIGIRRLAGFALSSVVAAVLALLLMVGGAPDPTPTVDPVLVAQTTGGKGYWLAASDGGIFNYGDAGFFGSAGGAPINSPVVGIAGSPLTTLPNNAPSLAITGGPGAGATTTDSTPTFSGSASDSDGTVTRVEVQVDGGAFSTDGVTGAGSWSYTPAAGLADGTHTFGFRSVDSDNVASSTASRTITIDATAPTVTVNQASAQEDPSDEADIDFTVVFSEEVTGFDGADVTVTGTAGGTKTATVTGSGTTYNVAVSGMTTDGTVIASVPAGGAADAAGNANTASTSTDNTVTRDAIAPTVTVEQKSGQADPTKASPVEFTVTFSKPVTGFTNADVTVAGTAEGTKTVTVTGSGTTYNVAVSGMTDGTVQVSVPAGGASDSTGNANAASTSTDNTVTYDATAPTVTIDQASTQEDPSDEGELDYTVVFSEPVAGFGPADVTITGTAGGTKTATVSGTGPTYNVAVSGMTTDGTVIASIPAGGAFDAAGNSNVASTSTDNTITRDTTAPTFTGISVAKDGKTVTATFSAEVWCPTVAPTDFTATINTVAVAVDAADCTGENNTTVLLTLASAPSGGNIVEVTLGGTVTDATGNAVPATARSATASNDAPILSVTGGPAEGSTSGDNTPTYTGTASDSDGTLAAVEVSIDNGPYSATGVTGTSTWTFTPTTALADGGHTLKFLAVDNAGATSDLVTRNVTIDTAGPTVTINQAAGQGDPTNASPITFTAQFSEAVTGFTGTDVTVTGTANAVTATVTAVDADTYTVAVADMAYDGTVAVAIPAGQAVDGVGNANAASTSTDNQVAYDTTPPTVSINQASGQSDPTNGTDVDFTVVFSEGVTGFTNADVTITGTATGTKTVTVTGSGANYDVQVQGLTNGTVTASIPAGGAADAAGNTNLASTSTDDTVTHDTVVPTFASLQATTGSTTVTATFSEPLLCSSVGATDFTATVAMLPRTIGSATCSGVFDATIDLVLGSAPTGGQTVTVTFVGPAQDPAGNAATAATSNSATAPTVVVSTPADNSTSSATTPTFTGTAADSDGTVARVEAKVDAGTFSTEGVTGTTSWSFTPATALATGPHTVSFRSIDNGGSTSDTVTRNITVDTAAPTVTVNQATGQADPTNASPINFTVTFSEPVTGFAAADVTISGTAGGTKTVSVSGTGATYTVGVSGMTNGTVLAAVVAEAAQDAGGNNSAASTSTDNGVTYDTTAPTVTINQATSQADPTNSSPIEYAVVFSEDVTGFDAADVTLSGTSGATGKTVTGSGSTYTVTVTGMLTNGSVVATVPAGGTADLAGNANTASTSSDNTVTWDATSPTVTINQKTGQADPTSTGPIEFTAVFSEAVTGFTGTDVALTGTAGGSKTVAVTGSGTTYNISVTGMTGANQAGSTVIASIPAGVANDAAANGNAASTSTDNTVTFDTTAPTVTINQASGQPDPTDEAAVDFTAAFAESVTGFTNADVAVTGTAPGTKTVTVTGSGATYNVAVGGITGDGTVIVSIPAAAAKDGAGNDSTASTSTDDTVTWDDSRPTLASIGPVGGTTKVVAFFSEPISCSTVAASGSDFTATVSGLPRLVDSAACSGAADDTIEITLNGSTTLSATTPVSITVANNSVADPATNTLSPAGTRSNDVPGISVTAPAPSPTNDPTPTYSGTASDTGGGTIAEVQVSVDGGAFSTTGVTGTATWSFTPTTDLSSGAHTLGFRSKDNQGGLSPTSSHNVTVDSSSPTVTVEQAAGQLDPTNDAAIDFTVTFSEAVNGFTNADVTVTGTAGGTKSVVVTGTGPTYNVAVSGMTNGTVIASIAANMVDDASGNANTASTSTDNTVTYDGTAPTVTVEQAAGQADPTNVSPINFTVTFSEAVTGFDGPDVTITGVTGASSAVTGGPTTYNVAVSGMSNGTVTATVAAGRANDVAGNANTASTSTDNSVAYDSVAPTVTVEKAAGQGDPTNTSTINFTVTFSEAVVGFTNADVAVTGTATGPKTITVSGTGPTYNVAVSGMTSDGTVIASVPAGGAADPAGNANTSSTSTDNNVAYDTAGPTATVNQAAGQEDPSDETTLDFTVVFSEAVTGFTNTDVVLTGTAGGTKTVNVTGSGTTYNVAVSGTDTDGTLIADVPAAAANDGAGNSSAVATFTDNEITYDETDPALVSIAPIGGATTPKVSATFSEDLGCASVANSDFTVAVNVVARTVSSTACTDDTVELTLSGAALAAGDAVSVTLGSGAVEDRSGNTSATAPSSVDNVVPTAAITGGPANNATTTDTTPDYSGTASDTAPGTVATVEVSVDGGDWTDEGVACTNCGTASATWTFTTAALSDGSHTVSARTVDNHGGISPVASRTVAVDTTGPSYQSVTATGGSQSVTATFNEPVLCSTVIDTDFTAKINNVTVVVSTVTCSGTSDSDIELTLASAPSSGQTVTVTLTGSVTDVSANANTPPTTQSGAAA